MSTRAYKVIELRINDNPTFNLSHDNFLMDNFIDFYGDETFIEINRHQANSFLKELKDFKYNLSKKELIHNITIVENILKDMEDGDYASYFCC